MSEDPGDRIFDFGGDGPPMGDVPTPGLAITPAAAVVMAQIELRQDAPIESVDPEVTVHYLSEVTDLINGAKRLRAYAMRANSRTGEMEIHNPVLYEKALGRIQSILSAAIKLHQDLWSQKSQMDFYRLMVQTIAQESPATAHRLIEELRKINSPILQTVERVAL